MIGKTKRSKTRSNSLSRKEDLNSLMEAGACMMRQLQPTKT